MNLAVFVLAGFEVRLLEDERVVGRGRDWDKVRRDNGWGDGHGWGDGDGYGAGYGAGCGTGLGHGCDYADPKEIYEVLR